MPSSRSDEKKKKSLNFLKILFILNLRDQFINFLNSYFLDFLLIKVVKDYYWTFIKNLNIKANQNYTVIKLTSETKIKDLIISFAIESNLNNFIKIIIIINFSNKLANKTQFNNFAFSKINFVNMLDPLEANPQ